MGLASSLVPTGMDGVVEDEVGLDPLPGEQELAHALPHTRAVRLVPFQIVEIARERETDVDDEPLAVVAKLVRHPERARDERHYTRGDLRQPLRTHAGVDPVELLAGERLRRGVGRRGAVVVAGEEAGCQRREDRRAE